MLWHPEKFTEVIFGQFSSTLMSPIYVYWLCKCQSLLKILRIFLRKILGPDADWYATEERTFL